VCPDKETQDVLREAQRQGFDVQKSGGGHYLVRHGGRLIATFSGTAIPNGARYRMIRILKDAGFQEGKNRVHETGLRIR